MFFYKINVRMKYVLLIFLICLLLILFKIFYIEVIEYNKLKKLSNDLYSRNLPISADRGDIVDRNGNIIATSITTSTLYIIPKQVQNKEEVSKDLSEILGVSYEEMYKHVSKNTSIEKVHPEGRNLSYEIADQINSLGYDGVYLVRESKRYYPYGDLLSHVIGYVGIDNQGLSGLELLYDDYLKGENGYLKYYSDGKGNKISKAEDYVKAKKGNTLKLTIDIELQMAVENELENVTNKYNPESTIAIVQDPNDGSILAMASTPSFYPSDYKNYSTDIINRNLPVFKTYEPGSTFKIITLASALEENIVDLFNDTFYDSGKVNVSSSTLHCWKKEGHGYETFLEVVENSCNPGFVKLGLMLGKDTLMEYIENFGFGEKTGIDLSGEGSGILFNTSKMGLVETATTAFGQGISVTPIQQITGISAAINGGYLYTPYVVKNITDENNNIIKENSKTLKRKVISKDTSNLVKYALESVVANGTGKNAYIENFRVGGKTGTAQKVVDGVYSRENYILSFVGFMPADNPLLTIYIAVDSPKGVTQYGGTVAAPIAKNIMISATKILNIKKDYDGMPKEYSWNDTKYIKVPNVENLSIEEAKKLLKDFTINYSGTGNKVIHQSLKADSYGKENGVIVLFLG